MGKLDIEGKKYFSSKEIFADAFNYFLYGGKQVIKPETMEEMDTAQVAVPYGNGARLPLQKYRDVLKLWSAMMGDDVIYVILGAELQGKVHYAMPVRDGLYDMIGYSKQVDAAKASYRKKGMDSQDKDDYMLKDGGCEEESGAELTVENGDIKIKLTSEEFLSGFRKGDKLIPIVTVVVYLGADPWDGPLSLYDMFDVKDREILKYVPNYFINLISPANMEDEEFEKFSTDLGLAMKVIKHQREDADRILGDTNHRKIGTDTAYFLNRAVDLKLELVEEEGGGVDMCLAMQNRDRRMEITGAIGVYKDMGASDEDIIKKIVEKYQVTKEYVLELLAPAPAAQ